MTRDDEKRLIDIVSNEFIYNGGMREKVLYDNAILTAAKAAREFREGGELRCGDWVQAKHKGEWYDTVFIGEHGGYVFLYNPNTTISTVVRDFVRLKPKTERHVKTPPSLAQALENGGYKPDNNGTFRHPDKPKSFKPSMWVYCGKKAEEVPLSFFDDEWLEEVEVGK